MGGTISEDNTRCGFVIPKDLKKEAEEKARKEGRSLSNYIVMLIKKDLNKF